jgi:hypothetical protein
MDLTDSWLGLLGRGISLQERHICTGQHKHRKDSNQILVWIGIRTHDPTAGAMKTFRTLDDTVNQSTCN